MDIRERAVSLVRQTDTKAVGDTLLEKAKLFCWETGLGTAINALPSVFGQEAVLYFPGRSGKYPLPCYETDGKVILAVTPDQLKQLSELLLQSPGVEIWLKSGWYAGTARLLDAEEQAKIAETIPNAQFFGEAGDRINQRRQIQYRLLEVTRSAPCTGSSGPGSKAWVWPIIAGGLFLFGKRKK